MALDDALAYDEPWGWMTPARHALGALLADQGKHEEAVEVYRADLFSGEPPDQLPARHPNNPWALRGLLR